MNGRRYRPIGRRSRWGRHYQQYVAVSHDVVTMLGTTEAASALLECA